jgi:tetratricopeptide (TPR) repeat protein
MAKQKDEISKKKEKPAKKASINIGGNFAGNLISGDGNTINVEATKAAALLTIPKPVQDFTGREKELDQLKASFQAGALITGLSGGGGVGKTELAKKLASEIADAYPAACLSIDLLGTSGNPLAPEEVMRRLLEPFYPGQKLPEDLQGLKGLYQQTFASQKALLLLDNAANETQVRPLIPPQPSAAIVTSRKHFTLNELGLTPLRLDVLSQEEARDLLRNASPKLRDASDADLDALATQCGRLPLALRVAASLLNDRDDWTPATLQKRLEDERTRLARLKRDGDLDLDVDATLSLSYNLLDDDLKKKFRQLGVFSAPFVQLSSAAVWEVDDETTADDLLGKFTNLSLLNFTPSTLGAPFGDDKGQGGEVLYLYALHDLTRLFAQNRLLEDAAEAKVTAMRHANHFLQWGTAADQLYQKGNENILLGLAQFRFIYPHLQAAYERLAPENQTFPRPEDADRWLSDFPGKCPYVLDLHLPPSQKISLMETALSAAQRLEDKSDEGIHLGNLGNAYADLGDAKKAIEYHEKALVVMQEIGDKRAEGSILGNLGNAYAALGDAKKAIEFYEKQLVIVREIGDRRGEGNALGNLGNAYADLGDAKKAIEFYEQALVIDREIGDRRGEGNALANLGMAYKNLGEKDKAREFWNQALDIFRAIESPHVATVENWLAGLDKE